MAMPANWHGICPDRGARGAPTPERANAYRWEILRRLINRFQAGGIRRVEDLAHHHLRRASGAVRQRGLEQGGVRGGAGQILQAIQLLNCPLAISPAVRVLSEPPENISSSGIVETPYLAGVLGFFSTSSSTNLAMP
jgi:hypothetical protein